MKSVRDALVAGALLLSACHSATTGASPAANGFHPAWSRNAVIYEVNVRQYTPEGTFAAFEQHLPRLKALGVDILWLMPVQPIGKVSRKGSMGSYYSIADYTATNPEHGSEADFKRLIDSAHRLGMKVILDWVANHSAFDHAWITERKNFYTLRPDGTISFPRDNEGRETDWTDVAELNYDNPELRQAMIGEMLWWVRNMGIDGFRADVAWGVPGDFWRETRRALKAERADLFLLAEAESPDMHTWADMSYGWELHHLLNEIAKGKTGTDRLNAYFAKQDSLYPASAYRMHFTSNHDENSWQGTEFERMGANHLPAFVVSATVERSMPLLYTGQEVGMNKRLRFFEKDTVDWNGPAFAPFYAAMFELRHSQPALWNGEFGGDQTALRTNGGSRVYAFSRTRGDNTVVVAVNFGDVPTTVQFEALTRPGAYTDWFDKTKVSVANTGSLTIPANGYRVLVK